MGKKSELFGRICAHVLFCAAVIYFFGRNCTLRFAACGALYKEYLVALLPLAVFYLTGFVLFPLLMLRNRRVWYAVAVLACSLSAATAELLFVAPQLVPVVEMALGEEQVSASFLNFLFFITLRDLGFAAVAHIIGDTRHQQSMRDKYEARLSAVAQEMDESSENPASHFFKTGSILFCQQSRNVTWIHLDDGRLVSRYGSLKKLADLLGSEGIVKVSRDTMVMRDKILSYDDRHVDISIPGSGQSKRFEWGPSCYKEAVKVLENVPEGELNPQHGEPSGRKTKTALEMLPDSVRSNRNLRSVYLYIARHPNCNATDIKTRNSVSQTTVNRILGQLKREGVIEYQGSKKYGGYRIVES